MNRLCRWSAAFALAACLSPVFAGDDRAPLEPVTLRFDTRFVLERVAQRMQVTLRPDVPLPAVFVESTVPLRQYQDAMEVQWRFRPPVVSNAYAIERNEIYLSDDASFYRRLKRTIDDSLAHELAHYVQAKYFNEDLSSDGCEVQAAEVQRWFREEYVLPKLDVAAEPTGPGERRSNEAAAACTVVLGVDGSRTVRCPTGPRPAQG
jgi:hypothetical protein